ncbi:hypothetical protein Leryth_022123 [Lithospermum erythrorhizon]|nr:hypothetical protein Leryth_022123 [Lithospermum erythrorhizon]
MARANVPQFGNWEGEDNVPYTVYFDKARKNKGGKVINPNDPQENPDMFPAQTKQPPSRGRAQSEELPKRVAPKSPTRSQISKEDSGEYRQSAGPAPPNYKGVRSGPVNESSHHGYGARNVGGGSARPSRPPSVGSEYSIDRSPLHPSQQSRLAGKGNGSPAYEGKRGYDSSHGTPSRLKPKTPDNSRDVAIPKFGEWDVSNPQSADNYTYIFNKNARGASADEESIPSYNSHQSNKDADAKVWISFFSFFSISNV